MFALRGIRGVRVGGHRLALSSGFPLQPAGVEISRLPGCEGKKKNVLSVVEVVRQAESVTMRFRVAISRQNRSVHVDIEGESTDLGHTLICFSQQSGDEIGWWVASETAHSLKGKYSDSPRECKSYLVILYVVLRALRGQQNAFTGESRALHSRRLRLKCSILL